LVCRRFELIQIVFVREWRVELAAPVPGGTTQETYSAALGDGVQPR
jgi:hypothetical protein